MTNSAIASASSAVNGDSPSKVIDNWLRISQKASKIEATIAIGKAPTRIVHYNDVYVGVKSESPLQEFGYISPVLS